MEVLRRMREVDGVEGMRASERAHYDQRLAELDEQIRYSQAALNASEEEKRGLDDKLNKANDIIQVTREDVASFPFSTPEKPEPTVQDKTRYLKTGLYRLLEDTDALYLAP